jgi:SAM-dependent methyltransferase
MQQNSICGTTVTGAEQAVRQRYSAAARQAEAALCCPVTYPPHYLAAIPEEILEKDYGCGDPSPYLNRGDTVVDLGSGGGKLCYIAAQVVGSAGRVIGVDCNPDMLQLARKYQDDVAKRLGFANIDFRCGRIQDLALNLELLAERIQGQSVESPGDWLDLQAVADRLRHEEPLVASNSVDCVVSNCVLNLVEPESRQQLFREILRVLKVGGRVAISDIVSDEDVPDAMRRDGQLWSGCISGAWREDRFLQEFLDAGFQAVQIASLEQQPWQVVNGIEFRSMTVVAVKPDQGACLEQNQAVIYRGPFQSVIDDDGHTYRRGQRTAVCGRSFRALQSAPYAAHFVGLEPEQSVAAESARPFDCSRDQVRDPKVSKGSRAQIVVLDGSACCGSGDGC